jgi:hypothetical protein
LHSGKDGGAYLLCIFLDFDLKEGRKRLVRVCFWTLRFGTRLVVDGDSRGSEEKLRGRLEEERSLLVLI